MPPPAEDAARAAERADLLRALASLRREEQLAILAIAAIVLALAATAVAATPVLEWLGLRGVELRWADELPPTTARRPLAFGDRVTLEQARGLASFRLRVPTVDDLDRPSAVYHRRAPAGDMLTFVYEAGGRPRLILSQWRARATLFMKVLPLGTPLERVPLAGAHAFWIGGRGHALWYRAVDNSLPREPFYLAAHTLLWHTADDMSFRLEAAVSQAEALRIARSLRFAATAPPTGLSGARAYRACAGAGPYWPTMTLAVDRRSLWVACKQEGRLLRIDGRTGRAIRRVALPGDQQVIAVTAGLGSIWAADAAGTVHRLDRTTGRARARIFVGGTLYNLWIGAGSVWTADDSAGTFVRISARNRVTARLPVGDGPSDIAFAGAAAYVINHRTRGARPDRARLEPRRARRNASRSGRAAWTWSPPRERSGCRSGQPPPTRGASRRSRASRAWTRRPAQ